MKVVVILHTDSEGPGLLRSCLEQAGHAVHLARLHAGDRLPHDSVPCDAVVSLGGPMNVYEDGRFAWLRMEVAFLRRAIAAGVPVVGICLGAQLIARACGAPVRKAPARELGWSEVWLTSAGRRDPLFEGVPPRLRAFQWHDDTFAVPVGGTLLATGTECFHQAFRYRSACALQFHLEVTREMLAEWLAEEPDRELMLAAFDRLEPALVEQARRICYNLERLATRPASLI